VCALRILFQLFFIVLPKYAIKRRTIFAMTLKSL
jgi:hypothetical protein